MPSCPFCQPGRYTHQPPGPQPHEVAFSAAHGRQAAPTHIWTENLFIPGGYRGSGSDPTPRRRHPAPLLLRPPRPGGLTDTTAKRKRPNCCCHTEARGRAGPEDSCTGGPRQADTAGPRDWRDPPAPPPARPRPSGLQDPPPAPRSRSPGCAASVSRSSRAEDGADAGTPWSGQVGPGRAGPAKGPRRAQLRGHPPPTAIPSQPASTACRGLRGSEAASVQAWLRRTRPDPALHQHHPRPAAAAP